MEAPPTPDAALLRRFSDHGDAEAFDALASRHVDFVYGCCLRRLGDRHDAEDAVQAVFVLLFRKAATLPPSTVLPGWLFNASRFVCADLRKMKRRREEHQQNAAARIPACMPASHDAGAEERARLLDEALGELSEIDRNAVLLRFYQQQPLANVAMALQMSTAAAQKRVERALEKLRHALVTRGCIATDGDLHSGLALLAVSAPPGFAKNIGVAHATACGNSLPGQLADAAARSMLRASLHALAPLACASGVLLALAFGALLAFQGTPQAAGPVALGGPGAKPLEAPRHRALGDALLKPQCVAFLDATHALSGGEKCIRVWDLTHGTLEREFEPHDDVVVSLAVSANGAQAVSGDLGGAARIWDVKAGREQQRVELLNGTTCRVALLGDGALFAAAAGTKVGVWRTAGGDATAMRSDFDSEISAFAADKTGRMLYVGFQNGRVETLALPDLRTQQRWLATAARRGGQEAIQALAASPDGRLLLTGSANGHVTLWDPQSGEERKRLHGASTTIGAAAFLPDGKRVLTGGGGIDPAREQGGQSLRMGVLHQCDVILWNLADGTRVRTFRGHESLVTGVSAATDGKTALSAGENARYWVLDLETEKDREP